MPSPETTDLAEVQRRTNEVQTMIDNMTDLQRRLFMDTALQNAHAMSAKIAQNPGEPMLAQGFAMMIHGLIAMVGYANGTFTRGEGEPTEADAEPVNVALEAFEELISVAASSNASPDQKARAQRIAEEVAAEAQADPSIDPAVRLAQRLAEPEQTKGAEDGHYGMYL